MTRLLLLPVLLYFAVGCGSGRPEAEVKRGQQAVTVSLDGWKANEPLASLKSLPDPIEFAEELRATHSLLEYTFGKTDISDPQVIRYTVTLKLRDKKGKVTDREVVYAVALKTPIIVTRDPFF